MLYIAESKRKFIEMVNRLFQSSSRDNAFVAAEGHGNLKLFYLNFNLSS